MHILLFPPSIYALLFLSWAGTIFYLSSLSQLSTPSIFQFQDKIIHAIAFAALAFFLAGALQRTWQTRIALKFLIICLIVALYGLSDEWHQSFTPGRHSDVYDVIADAVGAIIGASMFNTILKRHVKS